MIHTCGGVSHGIRAGEAYQPSWCKACWFAMNQKTNPAPVVPAIRRTPKQLAAHTRCVFRGERLPGQPCGSPLIRCLFDGVTASTIGDCSEAKRSCQSCPHFQATAVQSGFVRVPQPPPINLAPTRRHALVTVATGQRAADLFAVSGPLMRAYANRHDLDFVVLDWPGPDGWPMGSKFQIPQTLYYYERIIYVDADVILREAVPNLLHRVDRGRIGLWSDLADVLVVGHGFVGEFLDFRSKVGLPHKSPFRLSHYWNTGVFTADREHATYFTVPKQPIPILHCSEQHWWVSQLIDRQAPVQEMPREFNWQWWADPHFKHRSVPDDAVLHFSGWPATESHESRVQAMKRYA